MLENAKDLLRSLCREYKAKHPSKAIFGEARSNPKMKKYFPTESVGLNGMSRQATDVIEQWRNHKTFYMEVRTCCKETLIPFWNETVKPAAKDQVNFENFLDLVAIFFPPTAAYVAGTKLALMLNEARKSEANAMEALSEFLVAYTLEKVLDLTQVADSIQGLIDTYGPEDAMKRLIEDYAGKGVETLIDFAAEKSGAGEDVNDAAKNGIVLVWEKAAEGLLRRTEFSEKDADTAGALPAKSGGELKTTAQELAEMNDEFSSGTNGGSGPKGAIGRRRLLQRRLARAEAGLASVAI